jgi:hypothetical protein
MSDEEKGRRYRARILWRAEKHHLFDHRCRRFEEVEAELAAGVLRAIGPDDKPVLFFGDSAERWTMVGEASVASCYDGKLHSCLLDDIGRSVRLVSPPDAEGDAKRVSEFVFLPATGTTLWAPAGGAEIFALMNILQRFPLGGGILRAP